MLKRLLLFNICQDMIYDMKYNLGVCEQPKVKYPVVNYKRNIC